MFDPKKLSKQKEEKAAKKKTLNAIKEWCLMCIPAEIQSGLMIDVKEVICGDPNCAPIDTVITLVWKEGGRGIFALPMDPKELQKEDLVEMFPTHDVLQQWSEGKDADWPPRPVLRFNVGDRVSCRVGPHPVTGWAAGKIVKLYYREASWPPNMMAPYQIALHDGRLIFAPQDTEHVIKGRVQATTADGVPVPSPEIRLNADGEFEGLDDDEEGDEEDVEEDSTDK